MARGRWAAALAAVATLTACVVAPAAQADELSDLKEAAAQAKSAYDKAVEKRDGLKPARDKAQATLDEGTIGYFRARGADDAVRILTDDGTLTGHDYASDIRKMKNEGSSDTRLDSMLRGLKAIRQMNKFRAEEGTSPKVSDYPDRGGKQLKPLLVTDGLMAVAEAHGDRNYVDSGSITHYRDFSNEAENICGDWEDGMAACYYGEKEQFNGVDSNGTGHYLNIVNDELQYAGSGDLVQDFSMASDPLYVTRRQYWDNTFSQGRVMSVDDYEADVNAYKAPLDKAVSDYDNAAKAADNAKTAYDRAKAAADAWNDAMFTVSFDTGGGSDVKAQTVRRGGTASRPSDPTRAGFLFDGWYKGDSKYDFSTPVNADTTLTAHWKADTTEPKFFTVSFEPGNGQPNWGDCIGAGLTVPRPSDPTRSGYVFDGWYTTKSGGSKYDFSTPVTADLNLYAHWTAVAPKTFTVSFDTAGGSKVASQKVREGARVSEPADPTRSGHSFDGWYKGDAKYDFSTPVTADLTLTARWRAKAAPVVRAAAMHRLYNPYTGEHFYTADTAERDHLTGLGWRYEGVGWKAPAKSSTPVYRLYNGHVRGGDHHYTTSASERDHLVSVGWTYEGVGWYSDDARGVPLYRQYNPYARTGTHNYTASASENDHLLAVGWRGEGVGWYGVGD